MAKRVLFIDDQVDFLDLLKIRLKDEEYEKFFLTSTEGIVDFIAENDIDVVVSDMNMPQNGIELFKELREKHSNVVRVALSGSLHTNSLLLAINEGSVYKYISKPWKVDEKGKKIIRGALEYAEYLKFKYYCDCNTEVISMEKLEEILEGNGIEYKIIEREKESLGDYSLNLKYLLKIKKEG